MKLILKLSETDGDMIEVISKDRNCGDVLWCVVHEDFVTGEIKTALEEKKEVKVILAGPL